MKRQIILTCILIFCCLKSFEQQNITTTHEFYEISLNGEWQFKIDSAAIGEKEQWFHPGGDISFPEVQPVPGNWNLINKYASYTGKAWYRKKIFIAAGLKGKLVRLNFEGVYNNAKVWVNGKFVMENDLGYLQFEKDISDLLNYGQQNTIVVCADNSFKVGALWNWGGIRRPVKLLVNNKVYITQNHITPNVDLKNNTADISIELGLSNKNSTSRQLTGNIGLYQHDKLINLIPFKANIPENGTQKLTLKTYLSSKQVKLWSFDEPNLYKCRVDLFDKNVKIDERSDNFGLRTIEVNNAAHQLKLNGKVVRVIGFDWVPDDRTTGNTLPLWRVKEDIDLMKSLGINMARLSHMPFHKELLDYLDEKGILIFEEIPVWGYNSLVKSKNEVTDNWLRRMINDHYNHPCIAGWSVGNEIGFNKEVMDYVANSIKLVKQQDSTRMGVMISHTAYKAIDPVQLSDIGFVNAYGKDIGRQVDVDHKMHPQSTLFLSEFGVGQLTEDLSADFPIKTIMDSIAHKPYLVGASLWTFNDYRSWYKDTKEYSQNRPWGLVDVFRQKKQAFYSFQNTNKPVADMRVSNTVLDNKQVFKSTIYIKPRAVLDMPSYILKDYSVILKLIGEDEHLVGGYSQTLRVIDPGSPSFQFSLYSSFKEKPVKATISLVSPLNYSVYDTTIYFEKPLATKITYAIGGVDKLNGAAKNVLLIRYEKNSSATAYKLKYTIDNVTKETPATVDNYITVPNVEAGKSIKAALISINNEGDAVTELPAVMVGNSILPPLIIHAEPVNGGFFAGFETWKDDKQFIVELTEKAGDYHKAKQVTASIKGIIGVDSLLNGKTYYYHIKRGLQDGGTPLWSEEIAVIPDGGLKPGKPFIQGLITHGGNAVICFEPVEKSVGYDLFFRSGGEKTWHHELISASQIDQYRFKVPPNRNIEVRLAAIGQYGASGYAVYTSPVR